jgi:hypothetical protein
MLGNAGLAQCFDGIFAREDLGVNVRQVNTRTVFDPKDYSFAISKICAGSSHRPLANCAIIGDSLDMDVPANPLGLVTVIASFEIYISRILSQLLNLRILGNGDFAKGFDIAHATNTRESYLRFINTRDWKFVDGRQGHARLVCMGIDRGEIFEHL